MRSMRRCAGLDEHCPHRARPACRDLRSAFLDHRVRHGPDIVFVPAGPSLVERVELKCSPSQCIHSPVNVRKHSQVTRPCSQARQGSRPKIACQVEESQSVSVMHLCKGASHLDVSWVEVSLCKRNANPGITSTLPQPHLTQT